MFVGLCRKCASVVDLQAEGCDVWHDCVYFISRVFYFQITTLSSAACSCTRPSWSLVHGHYSTVGLSALGICGMRLFTILHISSMLTLSCVETIQHGPQLAMEVAAWWLDIWILRWGLVDQGSKLYAVHWFRQCCPAVPLSLYGLLANFTK